LLLRSLGCNLRHNHEWDLLRDEPRFQALLKTPAK